MERAAVRASLARLMAKKRIRAEWRGKMCGYIAFVSEKDHFALQARPSFGEVFALKT